MSGNSSAYAGSDAASRQGKRLNSGSSSPSRKSCDGAAMGVRAENSAGTHKINATCAVSTEDNQEVFIFRKGDDGKWRISRQSFSTTDPA
jgi:hypothetical protein